MGERKFKMGSIVSHINKKNFKEKDILEYPEAECLLKFIEEKIKAKRDWKAIFSGGTGTGKSYSGLRLAELWYRRKFNEEFPYDHICSNLDEAIMLTKKIKRKGDFILIEEVSASAGSRDAATTLNKQFNVFLDICRIKGLVICMNAPHFSFIDKHIRMSVDCWVDFKGVDFKRKISKGRPLWLQTSPHSNEPYKHRFEDEEGNQITKCYFRLPSKPLLDYYDGLKDRFTDTMLDQIAFRMALSQTKRLKELGAKFLSPRETDVYEMYLKGYSSKDGSENLGMQQKVYTNVLCRAKNKLKTPEYAHNLKEINKKAPNEHQA